MADNTDIKPIQNFSIQDTIAGGQGDANLLNDLFGDTTGAGGSPDDLTPIGTEIPPGTPPATTADTTTVQTTTDDTTAPPADLPDMSIQDFLAGTDDTPPAPGTTTDTTTVSTTDDTTTTLPPSTTDDTTTVEPAGSGVNFEGLAQDLTSLGVFNSRGDDDPINVKSPEDLLARFNVEKERGAVEMVNNFIGQFGEEYQSAFDSIFVKGVNPKEYFQSFNRVQDFASMDLTKEENQKSVLRTVLADQGFEAEDITAEIERLENYGDLEAVSKRHHKVLLKKEAAEIKKKEENAVYEQQQKQQTKNEYINNVRTILSEKIKQKEFDGIPVNAKIANELHDFLLVDKYKTPQGETLTDFDRAILDLKRPENHGLKVKVGLLLKLLESDPSLSLIQKAGVTKQTNQLFSNVARQVTKQNTPGAPQQRTQPQRWFTD